MENTGNKSTYPIVDAEELRRLRLSKGYTFRDMERQSGITRFTFMKYESGGRTADPKTLLKVAELLGVDVADLIVK